jgi:hypothetical protein
MASFTAPMRRMSRWMRWLLWVGEDWQFVDRWTTKFSDDGNVYCCFWHSWWFK